METLVKFAPVASSGRVLLDFASIKKFVYFNFYVFWLVVFVKCVEKPIKCYDASRIAESFCFYNGTFSEDNGQIRRHDYIQWIVTFAFLNSALFLPSSSDKISKYIIFADRTPNIEILSKILNRRIAFKMNRTRLEEIFQIIVLILKIYATNEFIDKNYLKLGFTLNREFVFPKRAKCTFQMFGPSGTLQKFDLLCVLSINYYFQYFLILNWFLDFIFLFGLCGSLVWRLLEWILYKNVVFNGFFGVDERLIGRLEFADWKLMMELKHYLEKDVFENLVAGMSQANFGYDNFGYSEFSNQKDPNS